jgi:hypothetical protein
MLFEYQFLDPLYGRADFSFLFLRNIRIVFVCPTRYAIFSGQLLGVSLPGAKPEADPAYVPKLGIHTTSPFWN